MVKGKMHASFHELSTRIEGLIKEFLEITQRPSFLLVISAKNGKSPAHMSSIGRKEVKQALEEAIEVIPQLVGGTIGGKADVASLSPLMSDVVLMLQAHLNRQDLDVVLLLSPPPKYDMMHWVSNVDMDSSIRLLQRRLDSLGWKTGKQLQ